MEGARSTERQACHGDILGCERSKALDHREDYHSSHFSTNYCLTELSPTTVQDKAIRRVNNNNNRVIILNKPNQGHTTLAQRSEPPIELEVPPEIADRCPPHFDLHCRDTLGRILAAPTIFRGVRSRVVVSPAWASVTLVTQVFIAFAPMRRASCLRSR